MKRTETHPRPTAGCLSVPLFNQRKRSRLPLTSNPSENEFSSAVEYNESDFLDSSSSGVMAHSQSQRSSVPFAPRGQWNRSVNQQPQKVSNQPARFPGPAVRTYAPIPHPHKPANAWPQCKAPDRQGSVMPSNQGQSGSSCVQGSVQHPQGNMHFKPKLTNHQQNVVPARQGTVMPNNQSSSRNSPFGQRNVHRSQGHMQFKPQPPNQYQHMLSDRQESFMPNNQGQSGAACVQGNAHHSQLNMQSKPQPLNHQQLTMQQSLSRQAYGSGGARPGGLQLSGPRFPTVPEPQNQTPQWKVKLSSQHRHSRNNQSDFYDTEPAQSQQQMKPINALSLRILTVVIEGMRHWSQFRNKAPMLFELFATLDSAVTDGKYGAKHFLMRTGKDVVSCVYFEMDKELPKLFRGLVHRCMGSYDRQNDTFTCVSVRLASRYEQKNSQEAIRASDNEMRQLVQSLTEI